MVTDCIELVSVELGTTNRQIVASTKECVKIGVDCAFGWPDAFVDFVSRHARGEPLSRGQAELDIAWRRTLAYRETDRAVLALTGKQPLSVSTDKLGLVAMRCAVLLDDLVSAGRAANRDGSGEVVEVNPGAALAAWGMTSPGYKTDRRLLVALVEAVAAKVPINLGSFESLVMASDDAFDAVLAALVTVASEFGRCLPVPAMHTATAQREGWVAIPPPIAEFRKFRA